MQVLLELLRPYKAVRVPFVCAHLNVTEEEVEKLLVTLIHEGKVRGRIDQVNKVRVGAAGKWHAHGSGGDAEERQAPRSRSTSCSW